MICNFPEKHTCTTEPHSTVVTADGQSFLHCWMQKDLQKFFEARAGRGTPTFTDSTFGRHAVTGIYAFGPQAPDVRPPLWLYRPKPKVNFNYAPTCQFMDSKNSLPCMSPATHIVKHKDGRSYPVCKTAAATMREGMGYKPGEIVALDPIGGLTVGGIAAGGLTAATRYPSADGYALAKTIYGRSPNETILRINRERRKNRATRLIPIKVDVVRNGDWYLTTDFVPAQARYTKPGTSLRLIFEERPFLEPKAGFVRPQDIKGPSVEKRVRWTRVLEYEGTEAFMRNHIAQRFVKTIFKDPQGNTIKEGFVGPLPEEAQAVSVIKSTPAPDFIRDTRGVLRPHYPPVRY